MKKKKNWLQIISQIIIEILTGMAIGITVGLTILIIFVIIYGWILPEKASGAMDLRREDGSLPTSQEELPEGIDGYYSPDKGLIVCFNPGTCLHEIGHKVDDEKIWGIGTYFSETKKWENTVDCYIENLYMPNRYLKEIDHFILNFPGINNNPYDKSWGFPWGGHLELYAEILRYSCSNPINMPGVLREFYDWEKIRELEKEYPGMEEWKKDCEQQLVKNLFDKN